ncbi:hypothetical protein TRFO_23805 [Tritrichomonas foetus]|uniref:Serine/threonine specific protein phosphatases domain-containing protein n=1 Tax=Tritrichomonas foetus TaxID=1144522 RepID=A0A1J4K8N3_9EUKA|nr:hypothetical protein TRFO_23805 [Tritrichomonas foetus]|eukprot:OHT07857.1 hypothetical protein TRFO_23805 [Tritrichomonas foetus]
MINRDMDIFSNQYATEIIWKSFLPFIKATEGEIVKVGVVLPIPQFEDFVVAQLCTETLTNITRYPKSMIEINDSGYYVVGDIHGNIIDLLRIVSKIYQESEDNIPKIIFLGDYVDRGHFSLEVVLLIFALYNKYPNTVVMLRGNHEFGRS